MKNVHCTRRTILRGLGALVALPWLESLSAAEPGGASAAPPKRLAVLFSGNGFHSKEWWAKGAGASMELGKVLEPLLPLREKLVFIKGLYNHEALTGGIHSAMTGGILSGAKLAPGGSIRSGTSFDQLLAQRLGEATRVPSLVVGCEEVFAGIHKGYSMIYSSQISWSSPSTPTPLEIYPALAFDQLFRTDHAATDVSVLDAVLDDAKRVHGRLGQADRHRLDEYLGSVREVETRIERAAKEGRREGWRPQLDKPDVPRPKDGIPSDLPEYFRLMCDLAVLAFRTDTTRICSLKLNNDHSSLRFPHLKVDYMIHHLLSHSDTADWLKVNQFLIEQSAYIARKLDQIQEGDGTALDNTLIVHLSSMLTGNHHNKDLPVVLLGGKNAGIAGGRIIDRSGKDERKLCSLYLSLMDCMGVKLDRFGDAKVRLEGLVAG